MRMMNWREQRKAGVTFLNIRRVVKGMTEEERKQPAKLLAVVVLDKLMDENPRGFFEDIDWDELLEFIEKLIALILKFLPFFV